MGCLHIRHLLFLVVVVAVLSPRAFLFASIRGSHWVRVLGGCWIFVFSLFGVISVSVGKCAFPFAFRDLN